jgi:PAS domain S-box-containing protein
MNPSYENKSWNQQEINKILIENLPLVISIYDLDGTFIYANEHTDRFFKMNPGEVTGKNFRDLFPAETADEQFKNLQLILQTGKPTTVERSIRMHGMINYFKATHQPLFTEKGEIHAVMVIGQNITEQARHEHLLTIQHQIDSLSNLSANLTSSLKKAFNFLLEIDWIDLGRIYLFDDDRKHLRLVFSTGLSENYLKEVSIIATNEPPAKITLKGKARYANTRTFLEPIRNVMLKEALTFVVSIPLIYKKEVIGSLNLGSKCVEHISAQDKLIIESIASRLANLIMMVKTREQLFSSNLRLSKSLNEIAEQQQRLIQKSRLESLGELSAGLAHEINQPLSVISLVMENITYKLEQKAATEEYLTGKFFTIIQNINKIRQLIDHVRIFSRDQGTIMFERVDVNDVILDSLNMIGTQLKNHQIRLILELSEEVGYTLGNPVRFEQVILNLLSNARDTLDEKETKLRTERFEKEIRVTSYLVKSNIIIKIRDNGMGIPKDNFDKIFNPFFTTKTEGRGTGLGLAIVYGIISEMRGEIKVDTEEMKCTEITITLKGYKNKNEKT